MLAEEREWIALQHDAAVRLLDLEFVMVALGNGGDEKLPHPAAEQLAHRVAPSVPAVEFADHAHALRIRRPHMKARPAHPADFREMRPELFVKLPVLAFGEEVQVERPEQDAKRIRIVLRPRLSAVPGEIQHVGNPLLRAFEDRLKKTVGMKLPRGILRAAIFIAHRDPARIRAKDAHDELLARLMLAEDGEGVAVIRAGDGRNGAFIDRGQVGGDFHVRVKCPARRAAGRDNFGRSRATRTGAGFGCAPARLRSSRGARRS
jgi:hypothetical protein